MNNESNNESNKEASIKKSAFAGMIWKFMERILAQFVSLAVSIVLARLLTPDDYSVVSIVAIFFAFSNVLISGGFSSALIQKKEADIIDYSSVLYLSLGIAVVMYLIMLVASPYIAGLYNKPLLKIIIPIMALTFFINAYKSILCAYISSRLEFKKFFYSTLIGTLISAVIGVFMAFKGFGPWSLVAQQMSNSLIDTLILSFTTNFKPKLVISWQRVKGLFSYSWKVLVSSLISVAYDEVQPLIVGLKFNTESLAFFNKGKGFPALLNSSVCDTISAVLFPVISKFQDNKEQVLQITRRFMRVTSYIVFPVMVGFLCVSDNFVLFLLTEKWLPAAIYIRIFCVSYMFNVVQIGNLQAIRAIGRSDIILILEITKKTIYAIIIFLFVIFSDKPEYLAVSSVVCTLFAMAVNSAPNRKLIGYKYRYQLMDILPNLILVTIMGIIVYAMNLLNIHPLILMVLQMIVGAVVYILLSIVTKNENFFYLLNYIKQRFKKGA